MNQCSQGAILNIAEFAHPTAYALPVRGSYEPGMGIELSLSTSPSSNPIFNQSSPTKTRDTYSHARWRLCGCFVCLAQETADLAAASFNVPGSHIIHMVNLYGTWSVSVSQPAWPPVRALPAKQSETVPTAQKEVRTSPPETRNFAQDRI
ncbi:hypothetical protein M407DRAFT_28268 [Tulasnella calospora MUT 4182]|uniref:Uncharacterized protein n=1 Tax=Tulasnella calospora MUT 4182 TaxID=1051891 RepID=A0A0C3KL75_9AGAM|nr:hypothetical protein M407DRAFT_28268 [Tulasnella calospora MUT 4182]